jgi:hypothetical protein
MLDVGAENWNTTVSVPVAVRLVIVGIDWILPAKQVLILDTTAAALRGVPSENVKPDLICIVKVKPPSEKAHELAMPGTSAPVDGTE